LEIDSDRLFQNLKDDFETDIQEVFDRFLKNGLHVRLDQEVTSSLLNFAPPGIDEIMALNTIMDLKEQGDFGILVLDTSPTGHLLRFLELPELVRQWLQAFFRLLIRYKGVVRLARVAEKAVNMAKGIRRIHEALTDPRKTAFVAVTLAEGLAMEELADLMKALKTKARIHCRHIVVNRIIPDSECPFCRSARNTQERYLKDVASVFPACTVIPVPHFPQPIQGMAALGRLEEALFRELRI
ncbi:MAG: ArsA-related P-loop ATPase, partial [Eubacteriales bacterium]|nr:ArsA-related P-loop ATPase [Eubacteriales bacterium]